MAPWRAKARELMPALDTAVDHDDWSCHVFLGELLHLLWDAHRVGDTDMLDRIYGFVRWCFDQPGQFLTNAAVISFYELVFDEWELRHEIAPWLPAEVACRVRPLWEWRMPAARMAEVDRLLAQPADSPTGEAG